MQQLGMRGHAPSVAIKPIERVNPERSKYERVWQHGEYREVSPGEQWAQLFLQRVRPERDAEAIDFGCGTGRGALMLALLGAMRVQMVDFAENCLDPEVRQALDTQAGRLKFAVADLTKPVPHTATYGYCCDVMEHIPPEDVAAVLRNILASAQSVFFAISTVEDRLGALIGEPLHLTVQPMAWWVEQLKAAGAVVHWSMEVPQACVIYCSAWNDAGELVKTGRVNVEQERIDAQVAANIEAGWQNVQPHQRQDREVVLLAGGPSLAEHEAEIRALREAGAALVTVNGTYQWAIERGLVPSAQVVLDAREFNARFVTPQVDTCRYLIASQVHPSVLDGLPRDRTFLWHSGISDANETLARERAGFFFPVPGGSTVILRAIPLLRLLGFWRMHIFGFDSCTRGGQHHAYQQSENDHEQVIPVTCGGRTFECTPWQASQASEFRDLVRFLGDEVELCVHGDGLIAHMIATGAELAQKE